MLYARWNRLGLWKSESDRMVERLCGNKTSIRFAADFVDDSHQKCKHPGTRGSRKDYRNGRCATGSPTRYTRGLESFCGRRPSALIREIVWRYQRSMVWKQKRSIFVQCGECSIGCAQPAICWRRMYL